MSSPHSVPGTIAGFDYQFDRALYWLAVSSAGALVGIETDDDVAVRNADSTTLLEQDKHSIKGNHAFHDTSKALWNTLGIWLAALEDGTAPSETTRFVMVTNTLLPPCLAKEIGSASDDTSVAVCVAKLESINQKPPTALKATIARVLRPEARAYLLQLIRNIDVRDAEHETNHDKLRQATINHLQLPQWGTPQAESIADELLGWVHRTAADLWQQQQPAWLHRDHFVNQLHAVLDRRKRERTRERAEHLIAVTEESIGSQKGRPFVRQLHLVTDDDTVVNNSIREFIRCNIEKLRLSREGNITDDDWTAFEGTLFSRWQSIRARVIRMNGDSVVRDVGFEIFTETTENYRERLAGSSTEQTYLTSGSYHRLADQLSVGWHPEFATLLKEQ